MVVLLERESLLLGCSAPLIHDVGERGVGVPALQADRAALRAAGSGSGPGGSAQPGLGHC